MAVRTVVEAPSPERLNELVFEAFEAEGYVVEVDGETVINKGALEDAVYARMTKTLSRTKDEVLKNAIAKGELVTVVFPSTTAPGSPLWEGDPEQDALWNKIKWEVNTMVKTGRRGKLQKMLGERQPDGGLILCLTELSPDKTPAVYITDDADLIDRDYTTARTNKLVNMSEELAKDMAIVIGAQPALKRSIQSKWKSSLKRASLKSTTVLELTAGNDES